MTSGLATDRCGFVHEAACYDSDALAGFRCGDVLAGRRLPRLAAAPTAGEPVAGSLGGARLREIREDPS